MGKRTLSSGAIAHWTLAFCLMIAAGCSSAKSNSSTNAGSKDLHTIADTKHDIAGADIAGEDAGKTDTTGNDSAGSEDGMGGDVTVDTTLADAGANDVASVDVTSPTDMNDVVGADTTAPTDAETDDVAIDIVGDDAETDLGDVDSLGPEDIGSDMTLDSAGDSTAADAKIDVAEDLENDATIDILDAEVDVDDRKPCQKKDDTKCDGADVEICDGDLKWTFSKTCTRGCNADGKPAACYPTAEWTSYSVTSENACAINKDGSLWCWGINTKGQLGTGETLPHLRPVVSVSSHDTWKQVAVSLTHTCAIKSDETLWCWGDNRKGQLVTDSAESLTAHPVDDSKDKWLSVAVGIDFTCAIKKTARTLHCWGSDGDGQLGTGEGDQSESGIKSVSSDKWLMISLGDSHSCGIKVDSKEPDRGLLFCWGRSQNGRLGLGSNTGDKDVPTQVGSALWLTVSAGTRHSCGIQGDGKLYCWGWGYAGQLGDPKTSSSNEPKPVGERSWTSVAAGYKGTCGVSDEALFCWGENLHGELGFGQPSLNQRSPKLVDDAHKWLSVKRFFGTSCALRKDGKLLCWGKDTSGVVTGTLGHSAEPITGENLEGFTQISAGWQHTCGLNQTDALYCWGLNGSGRLGHDGYLTTVEPMQVGSKSWLSISAGPSHTCAIDTDKLLFCWGPNSAGQLGTENNSTALIPKQVEPSKTTQKWLSISPGVNFSCGIQLDYSLWCWGLNDEGQLGLGTETIDKNFNQPMHVGDEKWWSVDTGEDLTCAIQKVADKTDAGALYCWGDGKYGRTGQAGTDGVHAPLRVGTSLWRAVSTGRSFACGIQEDKTLHCWGYNQFGQTGIGKSKQIVLGPTSVGSQTWQSIVTGHSHACGFKTDGTLWCWGDNADSRLTFDAVEIRRQYSPKLVVHPTSRQWKSATVGQRHTCAIDEDGENWCWGSNYDGQLGVGLTAFTWEPRLIEIGVNE